MKPRSLNSLLLGGDPDGVKVAQIAISNIQAIAFRRNQLRRVRDTGEALLPAPSGHEFTASALVRQMMDCSYASISATRYRTLPPSLRYRGPSRSQRQRSRVRGLILQRRARSVWFRQVSLISVFSSFAKSSAGRQRREEKILSRSSATTFTLALA